MKNSLFRASRFFGATEARTAEFAATRQAPDGLPIGQLLGQSNKLSREQVDQIAQYQQERGILFGEAAVELGLASNDDVMSALALQFHFPYSAEGSGEFKEELVVASRPFSHQAEVFRTIRSHLIMKLFGDPAQHPAMAILSPNSGDGKTYFAANLAIAFSQLPGRTLFLEADMRHPRALELFGLANRGNGLSTILSGRAANKVIQTVKGLPNLHVLPAGPIPPNPLELLERNTLGLLMRELKNRFDRIIVDTPAGEYGTDGAVIASKCGNGLIVARMNQSKVQSLQELVHTVGMGQTQLVGTILNEF